VLSVYVCVCVCFFFLTDAMRRLALLLSIWKFKGKAYRTLKRGTTASYHVMFKTLVTNSYIIRLYIIRSVKKVFKGLRINEKMRFLNVRICCMCIHIHERYICIYIYVYLIAFILKIIAVHQEKQEAGESWYEL
jgi:hypothetical protein